MSLHWQPQPAGPLRRTTVQLVGVEIDEDRTAWLLVHWQQSALAEPGPTVVSVTQPASIPVRREAGPTP